MEGVGDGGGERKWDMAEELSVELISGVTKLIHRDSILLPFFNASKNMKDRANRELELSIARLRLACLKAATAVKSPDDIRGEIIARGKGQGASSEGGGAMIDSGTTLTFLARGAFEPLRSEVDNIIGGSLRRVRVTCNPYWLFYKGITARDLGGFLVMTFHFGGGADLELNVENMFQNNMEQVFCLAVGVADGNSPSVIGVYAQQYPNIAYDLSTWTLSFERTDCQALEDRLAQMHEKREKFSKGSQDLPAENDILSQVVGKDKYGRVRMYGLGVSQSDVCGQIPSRKQSQRIAMEWKENYEQMEERFNNRIDELKSVRDVVCLKSIMNPLETVAKGIIQSIDPSTEVGGEELGLNWCEVSIQVAVKKDERLIRSYGFHKTIYDAYGATVAWPCPYVELESVDEILAPSGAEAGALNKSKQIKRQPLQISTTLQSTSTGQIGSNSDGAETDSLPVEEEVPCKGVAEAG
ncbi:hypothetical protein RJ639_024962 [Escallonia herrerae]|uniref:Peptidase A1 domain-containing protein n=1 Tax=Escallonia herrerae TaxID=1293975 RepID=A0AA89AC27_9ASTE|nr:hypothetical protein RJ639_024962 [Escallonia herrerae]